MSGSCLTGDGSRLGARREAVPGWPAVYQWLVAEYSEVTVDFDKEVTVGGGRQFDLID